MAEIWFGCVPFDAHLVAFDKDGTLIDFEAMWGRLARAWVEDLTAHAGNEELERDLYSTLGYDPQRQRTQPEGPLVIATTGELHTLTASVLYRHGMPWSQAQDRARQAFDSGARLPLAELVRPTGDVAGLLTGLRTSGVRVAVVTTDDRRETEQALRLLGVAHLVDETVCGDDGLANKPAPDTLLAACKRMRLEPSRTAVVGDTVADLQMGHRAGAGLKVAVLTGAGDEDRLRRFADAVLPSIDAITFANGAGAKRTI
jgi:HAD superfamily hydrolase (TIGR01509 family)